MAIISRTSEKELQAMEYKSLCKFHMFSHPKKVFSYIYINMTLFCTRSTDLGYWHFSHIT